MRPKIFFLLLGTAVLLVMGISWYIFDWDTTLGSLLLLGAAALVGVVAFSDTLLSLYRNATSTGSSNKSKQTIDVKNSHRVGSRQAGAEGVDQSISVKDSTDVTSHQE